MTKNEKRKRLRRILWLILANVFVVLCGALLVLGVLNLNMHLSFCGFVKTSILLMPSSPVVIIIS